MCPVTNWCSAPADPSLILQHPQIPQLYLCKTGRKGQGDDGGSADPAAPAARGEALGWHRGCDSRTRA